MTKEYQALARSYRPQLFADVLGQDPIIKTLQNALKQERLAHAYLFSGPRGTGKTTVARILAKALNCHARKGEEPCNACSSCRDITHGSSLDVLEIDGASHRGIDDIRRINETVGYVASGFCKIYIVDEVHMLTKEAFNALLKTLEEPPPYVKFFFATTEPHKIPATIISRCQRFQLNRIPDAIIAQKLRREANDLKANIDDAALQMIALAAEGSMRDAESILDQVISFHQGEVTEEVVSEILGLASRTLFAKLDKAREIGDLSVPFAIAEELINGGKNLSHFMTSLIEHYRVLLLENLNSPEKENLLHLMDDLIETQNRLKTLPSKRIAIEMALTRVVRSKKRIPIEAVVQRLLDLEERILRQEPQTATPVKSDGHILKEPLINSLGSDRASSSPTTPGVCEAHTWASRAEQTHGVEGGEGVRDGSQKVNQRFLKQEPKTAGRSQSHYDTVLRFAAVELEGRVEK